MSKVKNILIITTWSYRDALIQTYTLPYLKMIRKIVPSDQKIYFNTLEQDHLHIAAVEKSAIKKSYSTENIIWLPSKFKKIGPLAVLLRMLELIKLLWICYTKNISHIHVWCTPAGVTAYLLSLLTGKPLIIDSYEPHAEPSVENGTWSKDSWAFTFLFWMEKKMTQRAVALIGTSTFIRKYALEKYKIDLPNIYVKPALIDLDKFNLQIKKDSRLQSELGLENKIVGVYAGKIGGIYLTYETFDILKACYNQWGDRFRFIFLSNASKSEIDNLAHQAGISEGIIFSKFIPHQDVPKYLGLGDFGLNPVKPVKSKICCTSIKDGEYWALGLPVLITKSLGDDVQIIEENNIGVVIPSLTAESYLKSVKELDKLISSNSDGELTARIRNVAIKHRSYKIAEEIYRKIYL